MHFTSSHTSSSHNMTAWLLGYLWLLSAVSSVWSLTAHLWSKRGKKRSPRRTCDSLTQRNNVPWQNRMSSKCLTACASSRQNLRDNFTSTLWGKASQGTAMKKKILGRMIQRSGLLLHHHAGEELRWCMQLKSISPGLMDTRTEYRSWRGFLGSQI